MRGSSLTTTVLTAGGLLWKLLETAGLVAAVDLEVVREVVEDLEADHTRHEEDFEESLLLVTTSVTTVGSTGTGQARAQTEIGVIGAIGVEGMDIYDETVRGRCLVQSREGHEAEILAHLGLFREGVLGPDPDLADPAPEVGASLKTAAGDLDLEADIEICPHIEIVHASQEI